jgi:UDP-glucuronate 4-epimerase
MNVLVTGGAGFIGSHLVDRLLSHGHSVTVFDSFNDYYDPAIKRSNLKAALPHISLVEGDLLDQDLVQHTFRSGRFDTVVHLAARAGVRPSIEQPRLYIDVNVTGTFNLLEAAHQHGVSQFVFASSSSVYGVNEKIPFAEDDLIQNTISPYAATKLAGEQLCSNFSHLYGLRTVCLRFFTVYGPRQRPDLAIAKFTQKIDRGLPIDQYGDGSTSRDYTFIDDIVQGILGAISFSSSPFSIFNLGGSKTVRLSELIATIESALGKRAIINVLPQQPGDVPRTFADVTKAALHLDYHPDTPIQEGIPKYVEWYQGYLR